MKDNKEFIKDIYDKYEECLKDNITEFKSEKHKDKKILKNTLKLVSSIAIILIVSTIIIDKDKSIQLNRGNIYNYKPESSSLSTVESFNNFYEIIKKSSLENENRNYATQEEVLEDSTNPIKGSNDLLNSETSKEDYSKTNNQVENVEEADIVKTDGTYIYYIAEKKLVIVDATNSSKLKEIYKEDYTDSMFYPQEIYVYKDRLVVLGNKYTSTTKEEVSTNIESISNDYSYNSNKSKAIVYDISNKENINISREIELTGSLLSSRMIGKSLYIVANQYINTYRISTCPITDLKEEEYKPKYIDTAISSKENSIDFNNIECFKDINSANYLTIAGFNIDANDSSNIKTFLGSGEMVYASENNMYILKSNERYDVLTREIQNDTTKILKFSLKDGSIEYKAEADIPGYVNNQFSIYESNGTLKIATTIGTQWNLNDNTTNSLYILDENLKEIGKIEKLAKGEKIYSVRYTKNRAYLVTYKQIDPLFVIDITDNKDPKLLGELKIDGYSTYLHEYDDNHVIGFGYDTTYNGKVTKNNGLKMVMFDITDVSNPRELFNVKIGDKNTSSELLYDHKSLLYSKDKNIIGFPLNTYNQKNIYKAEIYNIDIEKGFTLKGKIIQNEGNNYMYKIRKVIYIENTLYALTYNGIKAVSLENFEELDFIKI